MSAATNQLGIETRLIHAGEPDPRIHGAVSMPVFQSATFEPPEGGGYHELRYIRLSTTPNHAVLHAKLADLEGAEAALVAASGMAAITTSLLTVLSAGDHLLAQGCLYGGTHSFVTQDLGAFGIGYDFIDARDPRQWERLLKPTTRAIYVETITNPLLQVIDLEKVVEFARRHGLVTLVDNTFASPINFRPPERGFDLSLHSATKYLNGHNDIVAGAVVGRAEWVSRIKHRLDHLGGSLDPHACFLLQRGLKTLALRVRQQNATTQRLAEALERHPAVARVHYPGLPSSPDHARAEALFEGCGGVLSFEPAGGSAAAAKVLERVRIPVRAPSLGGVETLITRPATTSHAGLSAAERSALGITDSLIRVAVGIESTADLIADFEQALAGLEAPGEPR